MPDTFQPGDIVQLNSGGPKMTVRGPGEDNPEFIACLLFDGTKLVVAEIPPAALIKVQSTTGS
jgi:uncharacterized protein YodC (DUF2158 family)